MIERLPLEVPHAVASGEPFELDRFVTDPVNVGHFIFRNEGAALVGTYHVEVSATHPREALWEQVGSNITAITAAPVAIPRGGHVWVRVRCSSYTSGEPWAYFIGAALE
jgi:hypothetical protein